MAQHNTSGPSTPEGRRDEIAAEERRQFGGMKFGSAFFGWMTATGIAVVLTALLGAVAGSQFNVLGGLNGFPRIPVNEGALTTGGIIALVIAVIVPLIGAVLGGKAGMRFRGKVDQVDANSAAGLNV
ncbi:hypothetical protein [Arthrobacter zhaoguopingii]|uniref:hypothetical protein n=1 Tax=Arthrobacter zhaoguopingii TaxID=2681491 RepID=UPI00135BCECD|nr:hypothetical protein [Arthrobacter zhaoguopingii]